MLTQKEGSSRLKGVLLCVRIADLFWLLENKENVA